MPDITVYVKTLDGTLLEVSYDVNHGVNVLKNAIELLDPIAYPSYLIILFRIDEEDLDKADLDIEMTAKINSEIERAKCNKCTKYIQCYKCANKRPTRINAPIRDKERMYRNQNGDTIGMLIRQNITATIKLSDQLYFYDIQFEVDNTYTLEFYKDDNDQYFYINKINDDDCKYYHLDNSNRDIGISGIVAHLRYYIKYDAREIRTAIQIAWHKVQLVRNKIQHCSKIQPYNLVWEKVRYWYPTEHDNDDDHKHDEDDDTADNDTADDEYDKDEKTDYTNLVNWAMTRGIIDTRWWKRIINNYI